MKPFMTNVFLNAEEKYQMYRVASFFNRVIELNQKMLILSNFLTKNIFFYITLTTELFKKYFCNIKFCFEDLMTKYLLFTTKLIVFKYCFIFIVLGSYTSSLCSNEWQDRGSILSVEGGSLPVCSGQ